MKWIKGVFSLMAMLTLTSPLFAAGEGGTYGYHAEFFVYDHNGNPLAGIDVELWVTTQYGDPLDPNYYDCWQYGVTNSSGQAYLSCWIPTQYADDLYKMEAAMISYDYTILYSENTITYSLSRIYPRFDIGIDMDDNQIIDVWEMPLAQKFCLYLILHSEDNGVRPVPVESMDRTGDGQLGWEDVLVRVYEVDISPPVELQMDQIWIYESPGNPYLMYHKYPHLAPVHKETALPQGEPLSLYLMLPHFEWGGIGDTTPESWYSSWSSFIQSHATESAYVDGTTYAHLFKNNDETVIQYWFFYPFNASANRHEGDWEHINVVLDSQNPNAANITRVEYYFHEEVAPRYTAGVDYFLISGTHPKVYVGGYTGFIDGYDGHGTHGSFPDSGVWQDINPIGTNEYVDGLGLQIDFSNYQNIIILPKLESIEVGSTLDWMTFAAYWGHIKSSPSAGEDLDLFSFSSLLFTLVSWSDPWIVLMGALTTAGAAAGHSFADDASIAPLGPGTKDTWETVYNQSGLHIYTDR
ncbi:MAG: hypothetical protein ACE5HS_23355 [bacterium]